MPNYCPNCGNKIEPEARFCPSCGTRLEVQPAPKPAPSARGGILESLNIKMEDLAGQWEARIDVDVSAGFKGLLLLTRDELTFVREGIPLEKLKESWKVPLSQIKSAAKLPLSNRVTITYNAAPEGAGLMKRFVGRKERWFGIKEAKSFIKKIKELNPNIK